MYEEGHLWDSWNDRTGEDGFLSGVKIQIYQDGTWNRWGHPEDNGTVQWDGSTRITLTLADVAYTVYFGDEQAESIVFRRQSDLRSFTLHKAGL
jgi:hypothetical protein